MAKSNNPSSPSVLPDSIVDMLVTDVLNKNGVQMNKNNIPPEKKEMLKKMVTDLSEQVNTFVESNKNEAKDSNKNVKQGMNQGMKQGIKQGLKQGTQTTKRSALKPASRARMKRK